MLIFQFYYIAGYGGKKKQQKMAEDLIGSDWIRYKEAKMIERMWCYGNN